MRSIDFKVFMAIVNTLLFAPHEVRRKICKNPVAKLGISRYSSRFRLLIEALDCQKMSP